MMGARFSRLQRPAVAKTTSRSGCSWAYAAGQRACPRATSTTTSGRLFRRIMQLPDYYLAAPSRRSSRTARRGWRVWSAEKASRSWILAQATAARRGRFCRRSKAAARDLRYAPVDISTGGLGELVREHDGEKPAGSRSSPSSVTSARVCSKRPAVIQATCAWGCCSAPTSVTSPTTRRWRSSSAAPRLRRGDYLLSGFDLLKDPGRAAARLRRRRGRDRGAQPEPAHPHEPRARRGLRRRERSATTRTSTRRARDGELPGQHARAARAHRPRVHRLSRRRRRCAPRSPASTARADVLAFARSSGFTPSPGTTIRSGGFLDALLPRRRLRPR